MEEKSFSVQKQGYEVYSVIHAHKNYELNLMTSGSGKRIVGNNISSFENNDLILIGPDLPHNRELLESIRHLFERALSGLAFKGEGVKLIEQQMMQLEELQGCDSFIALIKLLNSLTEFEEKEILSLTPEFTLSNYKDLDQIKSVYDFVLRNIQDKISLDTVAGLLHMAPGSFCRFFKKRTGKSFLQYVKDIRISIASSLLSNTEKPIAQISLESGYNN